MSSIPSLFSSARRPITRALAVGTRRVHGLAACAAVAAACLTSGAQAVSPGRAMVPERIMLNPQPLPPGPGRQIASPTPSMAAKPNHTIIVVGGKALVAEPVVVLPPLSHSNLAPEPATPHE